MSAEFVKKGFFEKIILLNILQHIQKPYHIIAQFAIEDFNAK